MTNKMTEEENITTTIVDYKPDTTESTGSCVVYKFRSRPPYEGFILILVIVLITALFLWWLNSRFA